MAVFKVSCSKCHHPLSLGLSDLLPGNRAFSPMSCSVCGHLNALRIRLVVSAVIPALALGYGVDRLLPRAWPDWSHAVLATGTVLVVYCGIVAACFRKLGSWRLLD